MTLERLKKLTKTLAASAAGSIVVTIGLAIAYDAAIKNHPLPDEPAMEASLVVGVFALLSLALGGATLAAAFGYISQARES